MNKNIDLTKILKDCPAGWKFYSSAFGEVEFQQIEIGSVHPIIINLKTGLTERITSNGKLLDLSDVECTLFPSREQRDWSKFTAPWYKKDKSVEPKFKAGDMVRHKYTNKDDVYEISKVYDDSYGITGFNWMIFMKYQDQYELVHNKFDPKTLKPFDKVLIRDGNTEDWGCDFVSHVGKNNNYVYISGRSFYNYCVPYNDDTKHLVGTTEEAPEYYRYWE